MSGHKNNSPGYFSILGLPHIGHTYYFPNLESTLLDYFIKRLTRLCWDSVLRQMFDYNFHQACLLSRSPLLQIFISYIILILIFMISYIMTLGFLHLSLCTIFTRHFWTICFITFRRLCWESPVSVQAYKTLQHGWLIDSTNWIGQQL